MTTLNTKSAAVWLAEAARRIDLDCDREHSASTKLGLLYASQSARFIDPAAPFDPNLEPGESPHRLAVRAHESLIEEYLQSSSPTLLKLTARVGVLCRELARHE